MINKRLMKTVPKATKYIAFNVLVQWFSLIASIIVIFCVSSFLEKLVKNTQTAEEVMKMFFVVITVLVFRALMAVWHAKLGHKASKTVKVTLRKKIFEKLYQTGRSYNTKIASSQVVQLAAEGVDQLEIYFAAYLPQLFYSILAPITLFLVVCFMDKRTAIVLLVCVPLIPVSIILVQKFAKKLLGKYWGQYAALGDNFLENLQGLTTLKIYNSDEFVQNKINDEGENFRKITMRVLVMQLNSITIMDIFAYGGAAVGIIVAINGFDNMGIASCFAIILLSAEFFIPMRRLGSLFHIAMNGMAAIDKIFELLDLEEEKSAVTNPVFGDLVFEDVWFSYDQEKRVLKNVNVRFEQDRFTGIVGESGCGKSTIAKLLIGQERDYQGSIRLGKNQLKDVANFSLMNLITYIGFNSYVFQGTLRENLALAGEKITDERMRAVLDQVNLWEQFQEKKGLDTKITEKGSNLSGGQKQRLALARGILYDTPMYIFDEATSNIDVESEELILEQIKRMAENKTIVMISHRIKNIVDADKILVLKDGVVREEGTHEDLLGKKALYQELWEKQQRLEAVGGVVS